MPRTARRIKRRRSVERRLAESVNNHLPLCTIPGCHQPTQRAAREGLSPFLCRKHILYRQRHGSSWCASPKGKALRPYVRAAEAFLIGHQANPYVGSATAGIRALMSGAGAVIRATNLRGLSAERRARVALARLREAEVSPVRLLAIVLAVHGLIEEAPAEVHRVKEWRIVAIAKAAHRLASGYHRIWEMQDTQGRTYKTHLHAYPRSSGRVLRILGEWLERQGEFVVDKLLDEYLKMKIERFGRHPGTRQNATPLSAA